MCDFVKQGKACADSQKAIQGMQQLHEAANDCRTKADFAAFMKKTLPIDIEEADDGIIMHLHKEGCTCIHPEYISKCGEDLCECTKAHEEYAWSVFFGKPVKVEIMESFLRGGNDCVVKLMI